MQEIQYLKHLFIFSYINFYIYNKITKYTNNHLMNYTMSDSKDVDKSMNQYCLFSMSSKENMYFPMQDLFVT